MMFTHALGMLEVVLSWTQAHSAQLQIKTQSSYIMSWVRHKSLSSATTRVSHKWPWCYRCHCYSQLQVPIYASAQRQSTFLHCSVTRDTTPDVGDWHCVNDQATSFRILVTNIETMFRQCCVNIVTMSHPNMVTNTETVQYYIWLSQVQNDSYLKIWILDTFATSASNSTVEHSQLQPYLSNTTYNSSWIGGN